jgi:hypothetical protein
MPLFSGGAIPHHKVFESPVEKMHAHPRSACRHVKAINAADIGIDF